MCLQASCGALAYTGRYLLSFAFNDTFHTHSAATVTQHLAEMRNMHRQHVWESELNAWGCTGAGAGQSRAPDVPDGRLEIEVEDLCAQVDCFGEGEQWVSRTAVSIHQLGMRDCSSRSAASPQCTNRLLTHHATLRHPRDPATPMLQVQHQHTRPQHALRAASNHSCFCSSFIIGILAPIEGPFIPLLQVTMKCLRNADKRGSADSLFAVRWLHWKQCLCLSAQTCRGCPEITQQGRCSCCLVASCQAGCLRGLSPLPCSPK